MELVQAIRQHGTLGRRRPGAGHGRAGSHQTAGRASKRSLGLRLFQRTTRRVSPTAEGEAVCERAIELLRGFDDLESELRERRAEPAGPIRLAATFGFGRHWVGPAYWRTSSNAIPAVSVQLQLTEQLPDLAVEGFDGAIWLWNAPAQRASEWVSRSLAKNQRVLVAARRPT